MMMQKIMTNALLLLSLVALTACPDNSQDRNNIATPQAQNPPPPGNNIGGNPANSPDQLDTIMKSFQCEFEGLRNRDGKYFDSYVNIPKTIALISLDSRIESLVNLRSKFLGFDIGKFGEISMRFVPASKANSGTDTVVLINKGLNRNMTMTQSGFAGQMVKLEAQGDGMFVTVSCRGISQFKSGSASADKTKLVCRGKSSSAVTGEEEIDVSIPLSSVKAGEVIEISKEVSAVLDNAATSITFTGSIDPDYAPEVTSTASLKSPAKFCISDKNSQALINVTCSLQ